MKRPEYQVHKLNLTAAGSVTLDGIFGVFRFFRAENVLGQEVSEAMVRVSVQATALGDEFPLKLGDAIFAANVRRVRVDWAAQPDVAVAYFLSSADPREYDLDSRPLLQLVTGEIDLALATVDTIAARTFVGGVAQVPVAAEYAQAQLWNPAGSGVDLYVTALFLSNTGVADFNAVNLVSATAALATADGLAGNKTLGGAVPAAQIRRTSGAVVAGTNIARHQVPPTDEPLPIYLRSEPIMISPGRGLTCANVTVNLGLTATFEWTERAA